ncbi:MAG: hypothetical protein J7L34_00970 [Thermotogaceae bacterium]|nr:hypothetical protein [Thermotogaceae bacterium]
MNTVRKILLILVFISILFLENAFFLQKYYIYISLKSQIPSLLLKEKTDTFLRCVRSKKNTIETDTPSYGEPLKLENGILAVSGEATPDFLVVSRSGVIVGKIIKSERNVFYVATPFSALLSLDVTLEGSPAYEGRLIGGFPPLVDIGRNANVNGRDVWLSKTEDYGFYLRNKGEGYLGKIKGKYSNLWIIDYKLPKGPFKVVGK